MCICMCCYNSYSAIDLERTGLWELSGGGRLNWDGRIEKRPSGYVHTRNVHSVILPGGQMVSCSCLCFRSCREVEFI